MAVQKKKFRKSMSYLLMIYAVLFSLLFFAFDAKAFSVSMKDIPQTTKTLILVEDDDGTIYHKIVERAILFDEEAITKVVDELVTVIKGSK